MKIPYDSYNAVRNAVRDAARASRVSAYRVLDLEVRTWGLTDDVQLAQLERFLSAAQGYGQQVYPRLVRDPLTKANLARALRRLYRDLEEIRTELRRNKGMKRLRGPGGSTPGFTRLAQPLHIPPRQGFTVTIQTDDSSGSTPSGTVFR